MFDFKILTSWIDHFLRTVAGFNDFWTLTTEMILVGIMILAAYALLALILIYAERKICAFSNAVSGQTGLGNGAFCSQLLI